MKNIGFLGKMLLLAILPIYSIAQSSEPFKGANTILISTTMSSDKAFSGWGRHLSQNGYSIDKSNSDFFTLTTGPKDTSRFNFDFIVNSSVADTGIVVINIKWRLKSSMLAGTQETQFYDWDYANGKGNVKNIIYNDLLSTITSFGPYAVTYEER